MLESLEIQNSLASDVNMDDIANMICHILQYFIQQQNDQISEIYVSNTGYILQITNSCCRREKFNILC